MTNRFHLLGVQRSNIDIDLVPGNQVPGHLEHVDKRQRNLGLVVTTVSHLTFARDCAVPNPGVGEPVSAAANGRKKTVDCGTGLL